MYYLLHKMQSVQDSFKLGAINVLRHLLNSAGNFLLFVTGKFALSRADVQPSGEKIG